MEAHCVLCVVRTGAIKSLVVTITLFCFTLILNKENNSYANVAVMYLKQRK